MSRNGARVLRSPLRASLAAIALLAFCAHALIPAGFMPGSVHGDPQLVVCTGHMGGAGHDGHAGGKGATHDSPCPFALGAGAAPLPALHAVAATHVAPTLLVLRAAQPVGSETPLRHTAPRGPPAVA